MSYDYELSSSPHVKGAGLSENVSKYTWLIR